LGRAGSNVSGYASGLDQVTLKWSLGLGSVKRAAAWREAGLRARWHGFEAGAGNAFSTTPPQTKHDQRVCPTAGRFLGYTCARCGGCGPAFGLEPAALRAPLAGPSGGCARSRRKPQAPRAAGPSPKPSGRRMAPGRVCRARRGTGRTTLRLLARRAPGRAGPRASQRVWFSSAPVPPSPFHPTAAGKGSHALKSRAPAKATRPSPGFLKGGAGTWATMRSWSRFWSAC